MTGGGTSWTPYSHYASQTLPHEEGASPCSTSENGTMTSPHIGALTAATHDEASPREATSGGSTSGEATSGGSTSGEATPGEATPPAPSRSLWRRAVRALALLAGSVGLFVGYLQMSRTQPANADGASQALQAWDMLHGNVLLRGWTVSDVSFYTNELILYALVELIYGLNADVVHVGAALLYTLLIVVTAAVAKGRATGWEAAVRVGLAVAIMLVPTAGIGTAVLLLSPDHTGSGIPLMLTWLVLDRALTRRDGSTREPGRWLPYGIALLLAWGQIADPLILFVGAVPLVIVSGFRLWRDGRRRPRQWRGLDARLLVSGIGSAVLAHVLLLAVHLAGGFRVHAPPLQFSRISELGEHSRITVGLVGILFGAFFPDRHGPGAVAVGVLHLAGMLLVAGAVGVAAIRALRRHGQTRHRVSEIMVAGIVVNICAFIVSTMPSDVTTAREIVAVLPLGAALAARVFGGGLTAWLMPRSSARPAEVSLARPAARSARSTALRVVPLIAILLVLGGEFVARWAEPSVPANNADVAEWLDRRDLTYGLGGFWTANDITLITGGRVHVAPLTGGETMWAYRWESRPDWYDPAVHDARFVVIDRNHPTYGDLVGPLARFGPPVERHDLKDVTVLIYDRNLLVGLPAYCLPRTAPSMAECGR